MYLLMNYFWYKETLELPETVPVRVSVDVTEADTHHKTNEAAEENKKNGGSDLNQNLK